MEADTTDVSLIIRPWTLVMTAARASAKAAWAFLFLMSDCSRKCSVIWPLLWKMPLHLYSQSSHRWRCLTKEENEPLRLRPSMQMYSFLLFFYFLQPSEDLCSQCVSSQSLCRPLSLITQWEQCEQQTLCSCSTPKRHSAAPRLCLVAAKSHFQE